MRNWVIESEIFKTNKGTEYGVKYLEGNLDNKPYPLTQGDKIQIGNYTLTFRRIS